MAGDGREAVEFGTVAAFAPPKQLEQDERDDDRALRSTQGHHPQHRRRVAHRLFVDFTQASEVCDLLPHERRQHTKQHHEQGEPSAYPFACSQ